MQSMIMLMLFYWSAIHFCKLFASKFAIPSPLPRSAGWVSSDRLWNWWLYAAILILGARSCQHRNCADAWLEFALICMSLLGLAVLFCCCIAMPLHGILIIFFCKCSFVMLMIVAEFNLIVGVQSVFLESYEIDIISLAVSYYSIEFVRNDLSSFDADCVV